MNTTASDSQNRTKPSIATEASVETVSRVKDPLATEAGHWYKPDGTPFYTYTNSKGGTSNVTLREARKLNAVPSVTTITGTVASPALGKYFERQMFDAVIRTPRNGCDLEVFFARCQTASKEHSKAAADKGTALHGAIECYMAGEQFADEWEPHVDAVIGTLRQYGIELDGESEKSFAHPLGFGGKVDYHDTTPLVNDFKSKPMIEPGKRYAFDNHAMQLAAYRHGLGIPTARCINTFVGIEDKRVLIHEWDEADLARGWRMFKLLLAFWQEDKKFFPTWEKEAA